MEHIHTNTKNGVIVNFVRPTGSVKTESDVYSFSENLVSGKIYRDANVKVETDKNNRLVKIYGEGVQCCETSSPKELPEIYISKKNKKEKKHKKES